MKPGRDPSLFVAGAMVGALLTVAALAVAIAIL